MRINAQVDISQLTATTYKAQKHLAYSVVQGINATAKQIQAEERTNLTKKFKVRTAATKTFLERQAAITKPFASVKNGLLYAEIAVGQRPKLLLSGFEDGDKREPFKGSVIAQPVVGNSARKNFSDPVSSQFTFRAMALKAKTVRGEKKFVGRPGAGLFTVKDVGVFRRFGSDVELLYHYARNQKLPKKLGWRQSAQRLANQWLNENITRAYMRSLRSSNAAPTPTGP